MNPLLFILIYVFCMQDLMQSDLASAIDSEEHVGYAGRWIAQTVRFISLSFCIFSDLIFVVSF